MKMLPRRERSIFLSEYQIHKIAVSPEEDGISLQELLRARGISRRLLILLKHIENGITCGGRIVRSIDAVKAGMEIELKIPTERGGAEPNPRLIVPKAYEDEDIIVYCKPAGMPVHESCGHRGDTLSNAFGADHPGIPFRAVNRLDRDTSGLCIAAKNKRSANIPRESVEKVYYAVCEGVIEEPFRIEAPIARERESAIRRVVRADGKFAATNIRPLQNNGQHTLLEIHLETGRTHQIRVHLSHAGYPLAGDDLYGGSREFIKRQALHCGKITFIHPVSREKISVTADIPEDIMQLVNKCGGYL